MYRNVDCRWLWSHTIGIPTHLHHTARKCPEQTPYENYEREDAAANRRDGAILLGMAACTGGSSSRTTSIAKVAPLLCMRSCSSTD